MKKSIWIFCVVSAVFSMGFFNLSQNTSIPILWINPVTSMVGENQTTDLVVQLDNISNVWGIAMELSFNPSVLEVMDADQDATGVQITPGNCPATDFLLQNDADNIAGTIQYTVTQLSSPPCDGGQVAIIRFKCIADDKTGNISFTTSVIGDYDGFEISHISQDADIQCLESFKVYLPAVMK